MTDASATAVRDARLAWIIGGSLFIGYAILLFAAGAAPGLPLAGFQVLVGLTWAAGLFVFAFGIRRSGSVVGRRPVGVVAMVVAGAMPAARVSLLTSRTCSDVMRVTTVPSLPARAVRPERCR